MRTQAAVATHALKAANSKSFAIDPLHSAHAAAVGATLADFQWNLKTTSDAKTKLEKVEIAPLGDGKQTQVESDKAQDGRIGLDWETGRVYGQAQVRFYCLRKAYRGHQESIAHFGSDLRAELCPRSHGDAGKQVHADAVSSGRF